jgi:hypothetical protein
MLSALVVPACAMTEPPTRRTTAAAQCPIVNRAANRTRPILAIHHAPSLTPERYEAVVRKLTNGRERLESLADGGLHGLLVHVAGQGADGFWIVDVWESQEAVDRFSQRIRPIAQASGIEEPLRTYAVHTFLAC